LNVVSCSSLELWRRTYMVMLPSV